jgi:tetratricopeptide (TPR) repeat protein
MSVIARSQITDALRQGNDDAKVCRALGATFVVRGAVHKAGSRLKVTLNVVGPDGRIESAGIVEDDYSNLFGLQNRLAEDLSRQLLGGVPAYGRAQPAQTPTRNVAALEHYWQGRALLDQPSRSGAIEAAVARFRDAIARDASFALAHAGLGDALWWKYRETRNPADAKAAIASSERARALAPDEPLVHLSLAQSYQETGRTEDAIRELDALLALQPNNDDGHRMLAALSERQGRPEDAIRHHQRAIAIRPGYWRNHGALGNFYVRGGRFAEAAIEFQRVTELQPDNAIGFLNLGAAYHNAGDYPRAVENYQRSIAINPTDYAYSNVGAVYHIQQRYAEAVAAHNEALKLSPEKPELYRNIADAYRKMGDEAAARKSYERAIQLATRALSVNAGDAAMLSLAALCEAKLSRSDRARQRIEEAIRRAPDSALVLVRAAAIEARAGNARGAIDLCERALSRGASRIVIREDDDFESIRQEPAFVRLTAERRGP